MEHRFSGHFKTVNTIVENYKTVISTLDFFAESGPVDLSVTTIGLKRLLSQEKFVFSGIVMREVLATLRPADKMFQSRECSIVNGYQVVNETILSICNIRTKAKYTELFEVCQLKCCVDVETAPQPEKRVWKPPSSLESFIATTSTGKDKEQPLIPCILKYWILWPLSWRNVSQSAIASQWSLFVHCYHAPRSFLILITCNHSLI